MPRNRSLHRRLLTEILPQVSRSFYMTLSILPRSVRDQVSLAYLFCRAADTIADTRLIEPHQRMTFLHLFQDQFRSPSLSWPSIRSIQTALIPHQVDAGERALLTRLEECFLTFSEFPNEDQELIRWLVVTLTHSMEMDLTYFSPEAGPEAIRALPSMKELDQYCYYVAGCVGEFWTRIHRRYFPSLQSLDEGRMCQLGIRFGKGLQMTNILRDLARDLQRGRCYIPKEILTQHGLSPLDLCDRKNRDKVSPLLLSLVGLTLDHLDSGWSYTSALPKREARLRLACSWPILFALKTLRAVCVSKDLLDPAITVKISRQEVYRTVATCAPLLFSNKALGHYYRRLRAAVF